MKKIMTSGAVAAISFGSFLAAAIPIFVAVSNAQAGLLSTFFPTFFAAFPRCLKNHPMLPHSLFDEIQ